MTTATRIHAGLNITPSSNAPTRAQVVVSELVIYEFYGDFQYRKSVDGGVTWGGGGPIMTADTGAQWHDVYYERWNGASKPNIVHLASAQDFGDRGIWYNTLDLDTDTLGTPVRALEIPAFPTMGNMGLGVARDGTIRVDGRDNFSPQFGAYSNDGVTWASTGNSFCEVGGDRMEIWADFAGDEEDLVALFWDESAHEYSLKRWDKSLNTITETVIGTTAGHANQQWSSCLNKTNGHIYLAALEIKGAGSNGIKTWDLYGGIVTPRTNVMSATPYLQSIAMTMLPSGRVRCYFGQDDDAASLNSIEVFYKESSSAMVSWGARTLYSSRDSDIVRIICDPAPSGAVAPAWEELATGDLYIETPAPLTTPDQYRLMLADVGDPDVPVLNITPENVGQEGDVLIKVERGRESAVLGNPPRAGSATFALNNHDLPYGLDEPTPGRAVRLNKKYDGTWYHLWQGPLAIPVHEMTDYRPLIRGQALGPLTKLAGKKGSTELHKDVTTGEAIGILLDAVGFPDDARDLDAGDVTLPYWWMSDEDAWSALWKIVNSEGITADFYEAGDGRLTFRSRSARYSESRSTTIQNTFRNVLTDPWLMSFQYVSGLSEIVNAASHERYRRTDDTVASVVWEAGDEMDFIVPPNDTLVLEAVAAEPFFDAITPVEGVDYLAGIGAGLITVTLERTSGQRTKITFDAGASGATLADVQLRATTTINNATYVEVSHVDASLSIAAHGLRPWPGEMSKELGFADMRDNLDAIVAWKKDPRGRVRFSINAAAGPVANQATAQRELGDRVRIIDINHDFDGELWLERFEHEIYAPAGPADGSALVGSEKTTWEASVISVGVGSSGTGVGEDSPYDAIDNSVYVLDTTGIDDQGLMMRGLAGLALMGISDI